MKRVSEIKARKQIRMDTNTKIHTPKPQKKERYKWNWRSELDVEDLRQIGIEI